MPYKVSRKECSHCHEIRPLSRFMMGKKISEVCNSCNWSLSLKVCPSCGETKHLKHFRRHNNILFSICTPCAQYSSAVIKDGYALGFKVLDKIRKSLYTNDKDV